MLARQSQPASFARSEMTRAHLLGSTQTSVISARFYISTRRTPLNHELKVSSTVYQTVAKLFPGPDSPPKCCLVVSKSHDVPMRCRSKAINYYLRLYKTSTRRVTLLQLVVKFSPTLSRVEIVIMILRSINCFAKIKPLEKKRIPDNARLP